MRFVEMTGREFIDRTGLFDNCCQIVGIPLLEKLKVKDSDIIKISESQWNSLYFPIEEFERRCKVYFEKDGFVLEPGNKVLFSYSEYWLFGEWRTKFQEVEVIDSVPECVQVRYSHGERRWTNFNDKKDFRILRVS